MSGALFMTLKMTMGIRVSEQVEEDGMDVSEHGVGGISNGQVFPMDGDAVKVVSAE